tara:strand:+ start:182 stop:652 length:471 start_codon:yes stop_codon:yes gene_type:complete
MADLYLLWRNGMPRIVKSVSLDHETSPIAESLPNFSHFVRECLLRHAITDATECNLAKPERFKGRCNPLTPKNCFVCWPNGNPPRDAVKQWSQDRLSMSWLDMKAKEHNQQLIDLRRINTLSNSIPEKNVGLNRGVKRSFMQKLSDLFRGQQQRED